MKSQLEEDDMSPSVFPSGHKLFQCNGKAFSIFKLGQLARFEKPVDHFYQGHLKKASFLMCYCFLYSKSHWYDYDLHITCKQI